MKNLRNKSTNTLKKAKKRKKGKKSVCRARSLGPICSCFYILTQPYNQGLDNPRGEIKEEATVDIGHGTCRN